MDNERIIKANPVLADPDLNRRLAKWNRLFKQAEKKFKDPYDPEAAKWISKKMDKKSS